jgi:hypothetical protein
MGTGVFRYFVALRLAGAGEAGSGDYASSLRFKPGRRFQRGATLDDPV